MLTFFLVAFLIHFQQGRILFYFKQLVYLNFLVHLSKSSIFTKLAISCLLLNLLILNLKEKFYAVKLSNFRVVIYSLWSSFFLFSTAVRAVVVANLIVLGILYLTSFYFNIKRSCSA